jgi:hypothetical protein
VIRENLDHSLPPSGRVIRAASSGKLQNSPKKQWKVLSLKNSLLYDSVNMVTIWMAAEGMVSMLELNVEKFRRFRVNVRYAWTGVAGIYATRPTK